MISQAAPNSAFTVPVHHADAYFVANGANLGDGLSIADDLHLDDTYELRPEPSAAHLSLLPDDQGGLQIAPGSEVGRPGARLCIDCSLTVMCQTGMTADILVLVELDEDDHIANIYALALAPITPRVSYTLVNIERHTASQKFAQAACVSFTRGTRITLADGAQRAVEDLVAGDMVLTRDRGPQSLRWIGHSTHRAIGQFAPIIIRAGALNNAQDLRVSPDHRLFVYQRIDQVGAGRSELLVRARHLINDDTIVQETGGFVDYYQLLFDTHQIIYAEGIAAETLLLDRRTQPAVPTDLHPHLTPNLPQPANLPHRALDLPETFARPDLATLLKGASTR